MYLSGHTGAEVDAMANYQELTLTSVPEFAMGATMKCFEVGRTLVVNGSGVLMTALEANIGMELFRIPGKRMTADTAIIASDSAGHFHRINFLNRNGFISVQIYTSTATTQNAILYFTTATLILGE